MPQRRLSAIVSEQGDRKMPDNLVPADKLAPSHLRTPNESQAYRTAHSDDVGFAHSLSQVQGKLKTGAPVDMRFRTTLGFRCFDGRRLIVHDHGSDLLGAASGIASLHLKTSRRR